MCPQMVLEMTIDLNGGTQTTGFFMVPSYVPTSGLSKQIDWNSANRLGVNERFELFSFPLKGRFVDPDSAETFEEHLLVSGSLKDWDYSTEWTLDIEQ